MISGHICDVTSAVKANVDVLSQDLCKNTDGAVRRKNSKKSNETVPLNDMWSTPCLGRAAFMDQLSHVKVSRNGRIIWKNDLLLRRMKCHSKVGQKICGQNETLWDKILQ
jgi:hypothetical protein